MNIIEHRTALLRARGNRCPDSLTPFAARQRSCALSDLAINHDETDGLFRKIIGWVDTRRCNEFKVGFTVLAKSFGNTLRFRSRRRALCNLQDRFSSLLEFGLKSLRTQALSPVDHPKERTDLRQDPLAKILCNLVQLIKKLDVSDQVGKAKLNPDIKDSHVFSVGRKVVATDDPVEFLSRGFDQNIGASRLIDAKEGVQVGTEDPRPVLIPIFFVTRLVDVNLNLKWQGRKKLLVWIGHGDADLVDEITKVSPREGEFENVAKEFPNRRERGVAGPLEIRYQCGQSWPREPRGLHLMRKRRKHDLLARRAPLALALILMNYNRLFRNFHLLMDFRWFITREEFGTAMKAAVKLKRMTFVNLIGAEFRTIMTRMVWLATNLAFLACRFTFSWRLDNIAGRRFGGIRGVLFRQRQLPDQIVDPRFLLSVHFPQHFNLGFKFTDLGRLFSLLFAPGVKPFSLHIQLYRPVQAGTLPEIRERLRLID